MCRLVYSLHNRRANKSSPFRVLKGFEVIACVDVHYKKDGSAQVACLLFEDWSDSKAAKELTTSVSTVQNYVPGSFYMRELPCIMEILQMVQESIELIIVDGYVWLSPTKKGLGKHLFDELGGKTPVVGVAKSFFRDADSVAISVLRGTSKKPLYVTAEGMDGQEAARLVKNMNGDHRMPTLLKRLDQLTKFS